MVKFYKEAATQNWVCGVKRKIAAGTCTMETNADNSYIEIKENGLDKTIAEGPVSSFVDETGTPYSSFEALDNATKDFFVKASGSNTELEARVENLENRRTLFVDYWTNIAPEFPNDGDIWFDTDFNALWCFYNNETLSMPLSSDSVYIERDTNRQFSWSGSAMVPMAVPLSKGGIESLIYSPKLTIPSYAIDLSVAEVFEKALSGATSFTINNPIKYKGFRIRLSGGSLNTDLFTGYTENWILNSLITDYVSAGSWLNCEIRESNNIHLFWGE
jgi:hypothetical protein